MKADLLQAKMERLQQLLPVPENAAELGSVSAWGEIESSRGTQLPSDYKLYINRYGSLVVRGFITVFNPFSSLPFLNTEKISITLSAYTELRTIRPKGFPFEPYPPKGGLIPWGGTENGDEFFWRSVGLPDEWTVVLLSSRGGRFEELPMSAIDVLCNMLTGELRTTIIPALCEAPSVVPAKRR